MFLGPQYIASARQTTKLSEWRQGRPGAEGQLTFAKRVMCWFAVVQQGLRLVEDLTAVSHGWEKAVGESIVHQAEAALLAPREHALLCERVLVDAVLGVLDYDEHVRVLILQPLQEPDLVGKLDVCYTALLGDAAVLVVGEPRATLLVGAATLVASGRVFRARRAL